MTNTPSTITIGGDLTVRRLGYGAMRLSDDPGHRADPAGASIWHAPTDRSAAVAILRRAVDLGVNLIDTADAYALGANEHLIAEALHPYPSDLVITTKVGVARPSAGEWVPLGHPAYLRQQTELSLRRLRTDHVDLLLLHRVDPQVPLADQIGALQQLREEGKVRHIGLSEVSVAQLRDAATIAPIAAVQNHYNLTERVHEDVVEHATAHGLAFFAFFPLGMGAHARADSRLAEIAQAIGATTGQVALAWLLHHSPSIVPIPGTTSIEHLATNVAALGVRLSDEHYSALNLLFRVGDRGMCDAGR